MALLRDLYRALTPSWMQDDEEGGPVLYSLGLVAEVAKERAYNGLVARFPQYAPTDALHLIARDRRIIRGIDEADAAFATRLLPWLDDHRTRGNPFALMKQLQAYCQADVRIRTVDARGNWFTREANGTTSYLLNQNNWNWDGAASTRWARFWVIIYPTAAGEPWNGDQTWGQVGLTWGSEGSGGATWGTSATVGEVETVRRIVREWKPAGTRCEHIIIAFDDASFAPDGSSLDLPDGTWASAGNRLATARYWRGTRS